MKTLLKTKEIITANAGTIIITIKSEKNAAFEFGIGRKFNYYIEASNADNKEYGQVSYFDYERYQNTKSAFNFYNKLVSKYNRLTKKYQEEELKIHNLLKERYNI